MTPARGPKWLLAMVIRLLPPDQRDWGQAMCAELDAVLPRAERWSFALGCTAAVVGRLMVLKSLVYNVITLASVAGVVVWSADIAYSPLRWGVVAIVAALAGVITLGRLPGPLGPVAGNRTARLLRGGGLVVVVAVTAGILVHLRARDNFGDEASFGIPILGSILVCYLAGFIAVTAGRSLATVQALRWGVASGFAAALMWLAAVAAIGWVPFGTSLAVAMLSVAIPLPVYGRVRQAAQAWVAALVGGTVGTLLIVIELVVMASYAPARMIPSLAPAALTPADGLEQSRAELQDPYVFLFVVGAVIALVLGITSMARSNRRGRGEPVQAQG